MIYSGSISYFDEASVRCMHDLGLSALTERCHAFGEPAGFPLLTGGPLILVGALLMHLPGLDSLGALTAAQLVFDALALAGAFGLMRRLGAGPWVALGTAVAWGLSPTVVGLEGFGGTWAGYVLLPAYAFMDVTVMAALEGGRGRRLGLLLVAYAAVRTEALFMDGYSFVASALVSACLWGAWLLQRRLGTRRRIEGVAALAGANLVALGLYSLYRPVGFVTDPLATFRSMGLDLATLVEPGNFIWFASKLGIAADHTDLAGDTSNAMFNYAGFVCIGLAAWYLLRRRPSRVPAALAVAAAIALVLSLGPALKVNVERATPQFVYGMPKGSAPELPWAGLFTSVPGLKSMRASYRWYGVTRMVLIVLAGLGIAELARGGGRRRQGLALALALVAVVEVLPTVPLFVRIYRAHYHEHAQVRDEVAGDLAKATRVGERVFFLSHDAVHNDFLANYLAATTRLRAYNAGGDKNVGYSIASWPVEVRGLTGAGAPAPAVERALRSGKVDVVVAPYFQMQTSSASWPPAPETVAAAKATFAPLVRSSALQVQRYKWFAAIRLPD